MQRPVSNRWGGHITKLRHAGTRELNGSSLLKYIREHWPA